MTFSVNVEDQIVRDMLTALLSRSASLPRGVCVYESGKTRPNVPYPIVLCGEDEETADGEYVIRRPVSIENVMRVLAEISVLDRDLGGSQSGITFDEKSRRVSFAGDFAVLSPRECELFAMLYRRRGHAVSRKDMQRELWHGGSSNAPDVYINYLRRRLRPLLGDGAIVSLRGEGYMLSDRFTQ